MTARPGADVTCKPEEFVPVGGDRSTPGRLLTDELAAKAASQPHLFSARTLRRQIYQVDPANVRNVRIAT
jgi:hypothetical protein